VVIDCLRGKENLRSIYLTHWCRRINELFPLFDELSFAHVHRKFNFVADQCSKRGVSGPVGVLIISKLQYNQVVMEDNITLF